MVPGVLFIGGNSISFATPDRTVFDCALTEGALSLKGFFQAYTCAFRVTSDGITYRVYLYPPRGAPKLSKDHLEGIGAAVAAMSGVGALIGGSVATFSSGLGFMGDTVEAIYAMGGFVRARRSYKLIQERVASYGKARVSETGTEEAAQRGPDALELSWKPSGGRCP
jgi:hypothetical protein